MFEVEAVTQSCIPYVQISRTRELQRKYSALILERWIVT
jgi:hypothetical protein